MPGASIAENFKNLRQAIGESVKAAGRQAESVRLLAVSKTQEPSVIREAFLCGQREFGENYVQESLNKISALQELDIRWHFIGSLQTNKVKHVVGKFYLIHSVDNLRLAESISRQAGKMSVTQDVLLQVNVGKEKSKGGFYPEELMQAIPLAELPGLRICGLMTIPPPMETESQTRNHFRALRALFEEFRSRLPQEYQPIFTELSMGMSEDFGLAIEEGATIVRIGTALFGRRTSK